MIDSHSNDLFQPGDLLNNTYRIEMLLGRGGTSDVYKARSEISGNLVAIKVLKQELSGNEDFTVLMAREENIREIRHDAVVRYSENHRTPDGHIYLLMDYIDGPGLDKKLKQGPMSAEDLMVICRRVAEGLQAAHTRNIVHRDLSPDNIILRNGDPAQAVIIDFGIAKDTNPGAETIVGNEFAGKYSYAAPEQMAGQTDARADVYALGALLLANFRGASPSLGANPMQVVENKQKPLDTDGLPEPFKRLIERMCDPNPDTRLASAAKVLAYLDDLENGDNAETESSARPEPAPEDATIIVPATSVTRPPPPERLPNPASIADPSTAPHTGKSRKAPVAVGLVGLVVAALVAFGVFTGSFDSLFGPKYPVASPFTLIVEKQPNGARRAIGNMPSEASRDALAALVEQTDITLASGAISDTWGEDVLAVLRPLADLQDWRLAISDNQAKLTGSTQDAALAADLKTRFGNGLPGNLNGIAEITYVLPVLAISEVRALVGSFEDCGPLRVIPGSVGGGFGPDDAITVTGRLAGTETRVTLFDSLQDLSSGRPVTLETEVLNPALCVIETHLPKAPSGAAEIQFRVGGEDKPNPSGRFFVGENPVIDVELPAEMATGYLSVSILDVSGNVFHLLPNISRPVNEINQLRDGETGAMSLRVAYDLAESARNGGLAFRVDDSTLGKSRVLVLHSTQPLFDGMRPTSESAVGFAEALKQSNQRDADLILSLDSKILETALP
ncbi:protein kinase [Pseudophaeobacter sp.]|uniref:serine/threonine protein kinase n=1 Tax=Pseudophaeobacter sp. TaxID=1971739 RepID=UPI00329A4784